MLGRIGEKIILSMMFFCLAAEFYAKQETWLVVTILLSLIGTCFLEIFREDWSVRLVGAGLFLLSMWQPLCFGAMLPLVYGVFTIPRMERLVNQYQKLFKNRQRADGSMKQVRDISVTGPEKKDQIYFVLMAMAVLLMIVAGPIRVALSPTWGPKVGRGFGALYVCIAFFSAFLSIKNAIRQEEKRQYYEHYDQARMELIDARVMRDQMVRQKEDSVYMATLQERNRIAREIHDNVGHLLTRAIVQMQAIKVINQDEKTAPYLLSVDETIHQAMLNIRRSVHELHDDSIDLSIMLNEIVKALPQRFTVDCRTAIESATDTALKNGILSIVREAVTNIAKYSKGDKVRVEIIEHAAFWRVYIHDNGKNETVDYDRSLKLRDPQAGMGLVDMHQHAVKLGGTLNVSSGPAGFDVLAILPKRQKENV